MAGWLAGGWLDPAVLRVSCVIVVVCGVAIYWQLSISSKRSELIGPSLGSAAAAAAPTTNTTNTHGITPPPPPPPILILLCREE